MMVETRRIGPLVIPLLRQPYAWKLEHARAVIEAALAQNVVSMVAWSGGRGSTVMLDLIRGYDRNIPVLFGNTGVEYPETVKFVKAQAREWELNLTITRPPRGVSFRSIVKEFGWPALGKITASHSADYWESKAARDGDIPGTLFPMGELTTSRKAEMTRAVQLSARCCYHLKERPQMLAQRLIGSKLTFLGMQACESERRRKNYMDYGELYFAKKTQTWKALPLSLWSNADLDEYVLRQALPLNPLYAMGHERTGCWPCLMSIAFTERLDTLLKTHPKLHRALIVKWGAGEVIAKLKAIRLGLSAEAFLEHWDVDYLYERMPCWFNKV